MVTPEDLVDENNRECCICFESHNLRDKVTRLPCAHIFHPQCINEWLTKHCTCPICRYELPTTNQVYESGRQERMATRKPRFASYELQRMKTSELMDLCTNKLNIPIVGSGYTKQEVIDRIVGSGKIDVISAPPPMSVENISTLRGMGVGKLKRLMTEAGVFFDSRDVIEKEDMVQIFINSGRIVFEEEEEEEEEMEEEGKQATTSTEPENAKEEIGLRPEEEVKRARIDEEGSCISTSTRSMSHENLKNDNLHSEGTSDQQRAEYNDIQEQNSKANETNDLNNGDEGEGDDIMMEHLNTLSSEEGGEPFNEGVPLIPAGEELSTSEATPVESNDNTDLNTNPLESGSATATTSSAPPRTTSYSYNESADISSRSISELKELGRVLNVDLSNCLEKREMIQLIVNSLSRSGVGTRYGGGVVS